MHLLITRPAEQAQRTRVALEADGHTCLLDPLLLKQRIESRPPSGRFDGIILTSSNPVAATKAAFAADLRQRIPVYATGTATADCARRHGFLNCHEAGGSALLLAQEIARKLREPKTAAPPVFLYPRAETVAHDMTKLLKAADISCVEWPVYRMCEAKDFAPETKTAFRKGLLDGVLLYSRRTALCFASLIGTSYRSPQIFALSGEICSALPDELRALARHPDRPSEKALQSLLAGNL